MGCNWPRVLDAEDEDTKEVILGTPTDTSQELQLDMYDSARKTNGKIYSFERKSKLVTPFGKRSNKFVVKFIIDNLPTIETDNGIQEHYDLEDGIIRRVQPLKSCSLVVHRSGLEPGCRFMYDRIEDRVFDSYYSMNDLLFYVQCMFLRWSIVGTVQCNWKPHEKACSYTCCI